MRYVPGFTPYENIQEIMGCFTEEEIVKIINTHEHTLTLGRLIHRARRGDKNAQRILVEYNPRFQHRFPEA